MMSVSGIVKQTVKDELQFCSRQIIVVIAICQSSRNVKQPSVYYFLTAISLLPQLIDLLQIVQFNLSCIQEIAKLIDVDSRISYGTAIHSSIHVLSIETNRYKDVLPAVQTFNASAKINYRCPVRTTYEHRLNSTIVPAPFIIRFCPCILDIFRHRPIYITIRDRRRRYIVPYLHILTPMTLIATIRCRIYYFDRITITSTERNVDRILRMRIGVQRTNFSTAHLN